MQVEFRHSQVLDEFGIFHTVVLLHDKFHQRKAEWPIARLSVWLDMVRNNDDLSADNVFNCVDMNWEPLEGDDCATLNDSLNSSRISLNLNIVKEALLKKPINKLHLFNTSSHSPSPIKASSLINDECFVQSSLPGRFITKKVLKYDDCIDSSTKNTPNISQNLTTNNSTSNSNNLRIDFNALALIHLRDMERSASRLRMLCNRFNNEQENVPNDISSEGQQRFRDSLMEIEKIMHGMRSYLDRSQIMDDGEVPAAKMQKAVRFLID